MNGKSLNAFTTKFLIILIAIIAMSQTPSMVSAQTDLSAGDLAIIGYDADADSIMFIAWVDLAPGTVIYFSDRGYRAAGFSTESFGEGVLTWTAGAAVQRGTPVTLTDLLSGGAVSASTGTVTRSVADFSLSAGGDQVFAYQGNIDPDHMDAVLLYGIHMNNTAWDTSLAGSPLEGESELPAALNSATLNMVLTAERDNAYYSGVRNNQSSGTDYQAQVTNNANWTSDNSTLISSWTTTQFLTPTAVTLSNTATTSGTNWIIALITVSILSAVTAIILRRSEQTLGNPVV